MPEPDAEPLPRGEVGTETWTFGADGRAVIIVPSWLKPGGQLPVLVALHGRGEAQKGPELGALGWPNDYALLRAIDRICKPPLTKKDFEGFVDDDRLADFNTSLTKRPFKGLIVVCPYLPDMDLQKPAPMRAYGEYLIKSLLPRVWKELPAIGTRASTGIDGVSLGGAVALRVGFANPDVFGAVGSLQAAIGSEQIQELTEEAKIAAKTGQTLKLLTSHQDYFKKAITSLSSSLKTAGVAHDFADVAGPHDYSFNRGPGALEMLAWHDRVLAT